MIRVVMKGHNDFTYQLLLHLLKSSKIQVATLTKKS